MNQFDRQQIEFLKPLYNNKVVLHFSFYANTFPIAYHFNLLLEQKKVAKNKINQFIKLHDWNDLFPSESNSDIFKIKTKIVKDKDKDKEKEWGNPKAINIFYTSKIEYKTPKFKNSNPFKLINDSKKIFKRYEEVSFIDFSNYCPRFVFLNNNLYTQHFISSENRNKPSQLINEYTIDSTGFNDVEVLKGQYLAFADILKRAKADGIEYLCVYTDTIKEAMDIIEEYGWGTDKVFYFDKTNIASLKLQDKHKNESRTLDIYFYGAPTTFHFLKQYEKFIPVLLDPEKQGSGISTVACLHYNIAKHQNFIQEIETALESYHQNFFDTAFSVSGAEMLNNARLAYNKYAKLIRHDSFFYSPESFSNCISLHHKYNNIPKRNNKTTEQKSINAEFKRKNIHVHYGAGKLGIGLILPLIKPNSVNDNQLIIIQKNRDEWNKKIKEDLRSITLSNTDKWELNLFLRKLSVANFGVPEMDSFLLFDDLKHTEEILKAATSISYSLGDQEIEKEFLNFIATLRLKADVLIFPFENKPYGSKDEDKDEFLKLRSFENLKHYTRLKADRICLERNFDLGNKVSVVCEDHIEVVLNIDESQTNNLFDVSKNRKTQIIFTSDDERYQFLSDRKEYLVNELHFILAVNGYDFLLSKGIVHWENQFVTIIQSALTSDPKYKIPIETFIRLQIIRLLHSKKYSKAIIKEEYNLEEDNVELIYEHLLKYAKAVTERFNASKEDQISRVFNTADIKAIERKYHSIIEVIEKFIIDNKSAIESIPILSAGTYLEYQKLIQDIKDKIENIFRSRIIIFISQVASKQKEQMEKQLELEYFDRKIKALTKKNI